MNNCDLLIKAGILVTQDEQRSILENAGLAVLDGKIAAIGSWPEIARDWQGTKILDLSDKLVMPGLINSHTHAAMTFLRGLADDQKLMDWLTGTVFPIEARLTPEIVRLGSLLGYAEMLKTGTTACVDMYIHESHVLEAAGQAGLRCLGGEAVFGFASAACKDYRKALATTAELAERYKGHERLAVAVNPHSVYTADQKILEACRDLALELDLPLHIHLSETRAETERCVAETGLRPVALCKELGLTQTRMIAAHLVDITESEAELLAAHDVAVVHNPSSNMKLASGCAPIETMLAKGMAVGLGTDGPASNNQLNMFAEMRQAALLHKMANQNPEALPAQTVLDMATLHGAMALGRRDLGALAPGYQADLIALDLAAPNLLPLYNPVSQIVYAASGHEICLTMVAGEVLYENGKFSRFDYPSLVSETAKLRQFALKAR